MKMYFYERFCVWLGHLKLSRVIITVSIILFIVPLVTHYYLAKYETSSISFDNNPVRESLEALGDLTNLNAADLKIRIEEMLRIKASVSTELRELEARRARLQHEAAAAAAAADSARADHARAQQELQRLRASADQARLAQLDAMRRDAPVLAPPLRLLPSQPPSPNPPPNPADEIHCTMHSCFDYSRCALTSGFPVYFYEPDEHSLLVGAEVDGFLKTSLKQVLGANPHITADPNIACVYVVLIGEAFPVDKTKSANELDWKLNTTALKKLPYWGGDGRNHILLSVSRRELARPRGVIGGVGRAMIAQAHFPLGRYRRGFDLITPPALGPPSGDVWKDCEPIAPARRHYLLSFQGSQTPLDGEAGEADRRVIGALNKAAEGAGGERGAENTLALIELQWQCEPGVEAAPPGEWALCGTERSRRSLLSRSTFALLPATRADSSALLLARLYEAIRAAAIPLLLVTHNTHLPFDEVIDWDRAVLTVPAARAAELPLLMRSIPDADLLQMRRQGRNIWERYMSSLQAACDSLLSLVRTRLRLPPAPAPPAPAPPAFGASHAPPRPQPPQVDSAPDETLGPLEPPFPSPAYMRNFSIGFVNKYSAWNEWFSPWWLYPQLPWDPAVTSEARFAGSGAGFRPLGGGAGGAGAELSVALGGDRPREQFTIVILTYERESVLAAALTRLRHLPYLNKVVVVWNGASSPQSMTWPESGAPIAVVRAAKNSLNNRFLPYDVIETEAVLCVDDDAHLRHDEIIFAFRVWRQHRDQIVGFPGRYHAWDLNFNNGFLYNSNYSCELSMVLTGAAFVHRYYMFAYWTQLPQAVRDLVDEHVNCEDIAMNFLVAHITRKPPVKVTSRWTFRCPGCPVTLSADETHFNERHKCIQFFSEVMGYTPLMLTQYRADSVLFKTRISHDKQKCFKFI